MAALANPEPLPVGEFKTFGPWGPMYELIRTAPSVDGEAMVHIRVMFTEEELDYPLAEMLADPFKL